MSNRNPAELILSGLNNEQREAVCHGNGPLSIVAGAVLARRARSCIASRI